MRLIAHRGFAATHPENTVAAIRSAARRADAVEFDVRRCGSGELVVVHDERIDRVTSGVGRVADTPLRELRTLTVLDSDERIPTLDEVLDSLPPDAAVNLELKDLDVAEDVLEALESVENRVVVTSFLTPELRRIRELDPGQPTGLLVGSELDRPVTTAVELGCVAIGANYRRCLRTRLVARAHAVDLEVHAWGVRRAIEATVLDRIGVDYVSADRPIAI